MKTITSARLRQPEPLSEFAMCMRSFSRMVAICFAALFFLTACGGADVESGNSNLLTCDVPNVPNESGTECVPPPPIACDPPTVPNQANDACVVGANPDLPDPVFFPGANQAVLYYNRGDVDADNTPNDPAYDGWKLHTWNNDECDAYADPDTAWDNGRTISGIDPTYGAYWVLDLKADYGSCHNFIIHKGTDDAGKEMGGGDFQASLVQDDETYVRMNFTLSGEPTLFEYPIDSLGPQPVEIEGAAAHWLDANTFVWNAPEAVMEVKLHYSADASLETSLEEGLNGEVIALQSASLSEEQRQIYPYVADWPAFAGDWSAEDAKAVLQTQTVLGGYDSDGKLIAATDIQIARVLDQLYTQSDNDADEATLGVTYADGQITARVWAPTAQSVALLSYNDNKTLANRIDMQRDDASGVWSYTGDMALDRTLYRYEVTVYTPATDAIETLEVTDPYSVSVTTNGRFSRFVNLADDDLKPAGWDDHSVPTIANPEDAVIYEGHIRDFSARDESVSEENRGNYLAFTETNSAPVMHLQKLVDAGLNYFHILPANDIASINEDPAQSINLYSTIGDLCRLNRDATVCDEEAADARIIDVYESYSPSTEQGKAQELTQRLQGIDTFNWGYDPHHFSAPEGSYASDAESVARIVEMRAMVQALHELGLRVALDVVYNHTNESGVFPKSVLDKTVPGYYHRYDAESGEIIRETCCEDTEPQNVMMEKLMKDSLVMWASEYKYDAFRFDIMSQATVDTMVRLREAVQAVDADNYFYGEGWVKTYPGYEQASQFNMAGTQIGTFNDRIREAVRQGNIFSRDASTGLADQDKVKMSLAGTLTNFLLETHTGAAVETQALGGYALDPADIINYVSKHDNETLWDQFNYTLPDDISLAERVRAQNIGISIPLMAQGIPFLQMGGDMLRSKSMDRDSYNSGDWFNYVDFTYTTNNWNVGLPPAEKNEERWPEMLQFIFEPERDAQMSDILYASDIFAEFLQIRTTSPLFRLTTAEAIKQRVGFHNLGKNQQAGLIAMSLDDGFNESDETPLADLDPSVDAMMVVINTGYSEKTIEVATASGFQLHPVLANSMDATVASASFNEGENGGQFTVPALTMAVFVKPQSGAQGYGLSAIATSGAPDVAPYNDTTVLLRGDMNSWGTTDSFTYQGDGVYTASAMLSANSTYGFKVASEDWSTVNMGADAVATVALDEAVTLRAGGDNLAFTAPTDALYEFVLDASADKDTPVLTVRYEEPYANTTVYLRGDFNSWGTDNAFTYRGDKLYGAAITLDPGTYQFKAANEDYSVVNFGATQDTAEARAVAVDGQVALADNGSNLEVTIEETNDYVFVFDLTDAANPVLKVFVEDFFAGTAVYLRGEMTDWGTSAQFAYQGGGVYTVTVTLDGGPKQFKVASEDWSTVNLGNPDDAASNEVSLGKMKILGTSNNNLLIDAPAGTYLFTVEGPDKLNLRLTVTAM